MQLDTVYSVETPEGIALSLRPAGPVARALAYLIDAGLRLALFLCCLLLAALLGAMGQAFAFIAFFAIEWLYPIFFELAVAGATPGKRMLGLQVVMDSGLPVTPAASVARNLLRSADFLPALYAFGLLSMLLRTDFKRLGDLAAGTLVVHVQPVSLHGGLPDAPPLAPRRPLSPREQMAVVSWASRSATLTRERLDELAGLAQDVVPAEAATDPAGGPTLALLGVAQWLLGRRREAAP
jgi:uncharacterized RDD family membrane protein YckC